MLHSQDRKSNSELANRTVIRISVVLALLAVSLLALASGSLHSAAADSRGSTTVAERSNHRISMRGSASAPKSASTATTLVAPLVTITVDRTDDDGGAASACTAAANDCSLRGSVAFANLNPGTVISLPAGTYQLSIPGGAVEGFSGNNSIGDLDVTGNNTSIVGAGASSTTIDQTQPNDRVLEVNPNLLAAFNFSISGVTIFSGSETTGVGGGGIIAGSINNTTSVINCVISGNSATGAGTLGGGGIQTMGGSLTITGTTFSSNSTTGSGGGLSYTAGDPLIRQPSNGTLTISGSTFSGNSSTSVAAGGGGADLFNFNASIGAYNINSSSFSGNTAATANGGAIIVESGPLTLTTSSLSGNSAGISGGAISSSGSAVVNYSRFVGNTVPVATNGLSIFSTNGSVSADDNWWGMNTGPSANAIRTSTGSILPLTYLQLRASASPNEICTGQSSTITADIKQRNAGAPLTTELNGLPAFPVPPGTIFNNAVLGTVSGASTQFINGVATATYTAGGTNGMGSVDATADNQTVTATISISTNATTDPADVSVCQGQDANFSTTASGPGPFSYAWTVDGSPFNGDSPNILVPTGSLSIGSHTVQVTVTGACGNAVQSATLTVQTPTATTDPADVAACQGEDAHFSTTASGTGPFHYAWTLDGNPFNGDNPSITIPTGSLSPGNHTVQVTTTGACGSAVQTATLTVGGVPVITLSTTTVSVWPPNHSYQTFNVTDFVASASSTCDPNVDVNDVVIQKVSSDEPENTAGADGNTLNDIVIAADCKSVQLRRERDSNLNGRVYTITFKVTDAFGNSTTATVTVTVPIDQSSGGAVNDGAAAGYTVNSLCP